MATEKKIANTTTGNYYMVIRNKHRVPGCKFSCIKILIFMVSKYVCFSTLSVVPFCLLVCGCLGVCVCLVAFLTVSIHNLLWRCISSGGSA